MRNKTMLATFVVLIVVLIASGCGTPKVDWELQVDGAVSNPLTLSYAELAKMPQADLGDVLMQRSRGEDTVESWSGVALADVFEQAGASADYASVTAVADDGYAIEISKDELQDAIIALKQNGEWIATADAEHGPIRLVTPQTPANRWVFQLRALQVNEQASGIPADAAFKITGQVKAEIGWTEEQVRAMDAMEAQTTNKAGETQTYTGVSVNDLLGKAGIAEGAATLVFVADDGYTAEVALAEVQACADCIVAFDDEGGFRMVLPGFPGNAQVKGVVEIQVQ